MGDKATMFAPKGWWINSKQWQREKGSHFLKNMERVLELNVTMVKCKDKYQLQIYLSSLTALYPLLAFPNSKADAFPPAWAHLPSPNRLLSMKAKQFQTQQLCPCFPSLYKQLYGSLHDSIHSQVFSWSRLQPQAKPITPHLRCLALASDHA